MDANLLSWLLPTGLDEQRAKLYLVTLNKGDTSAKELAEKLGINRTAVYDNLRVLEERGFVTTIHKGKRKHFVPLHPKELYKKIENQKKQLKDLLPDFLSLYAQKSLQPFVQLFTGKFAAREVYEDILATAKKNYVYLLPPKLTLQMVDQEWMKGWIKKRVKQKLYSRSLRVKSAELNDHPIFAGEQEYLRQIRYLPNHIELKSSIYIYENNISVISTKKEGSAFIIHSPDLAYSFKQIFEFLWEICLKT